MSNPLARKVEWWHVALGAVAAGIAVRAISPARASFPLGDEDLQLRIAPYGLPSDYSTYAEKNWSGRCHAYPGAIGEQLTALMYAGPPDYANQGG
jgi:hypothetical protein